MADVKPIKLNGAELEVFQSGDTIPLDAGGTGATTAGAARTSLGLAIGTDVQAYNANLGAVAGVTGTGYLVRTGTNTFTTREITGTAGRTTTSQPNGASGNTVIDLATVSNAGGGTFSKLTVDAYGRVSGTSAVTTGDLTPLLNSTYAPINNPTFTGTVTLPGDPTTSLGAATKQWVEALLASGGVPPFLEVKAKTTANINLAAPGATHDGVTLVNGDRFLVASQTTASQNGLYVFTAAGTPATRASDADQSGEFTPARTVFVQLGSLYANTGWAVANSSQPTIGTDPITFTQVSGSQSYTAGNGLNLIGTQFSVKPKVNEIVVDGTGVGLATSGVSAGTYTKVTVDTFGRVTVGATAVPADIGAQPVNAFLTSLAGAGTNGIIVKNGNNVLSRTIQQGAGIVVTNGDGVSGNPSIALGTSGVTGGTYNSVTVDVYGRVTAGTVNDTAFQTINMENASGAGMVIGEAVYVSAAGQVQKALANAANTKNVVGLVYNTTINSAATGKIITSGQLTATTGQWDAVTGQSGGLTSGARYYLNNTTAGRLTTSAPGSGYVAPIGIATSATTLVVNILTTVKL